MSTKDWADAMTRAGHAPIFVSPSKALEPIVELATAREFAASLGHRFGIELTDVETCSEPNHGFPDCFAKRNEARVSIELTELVRGELRGREHVRWEEKLWTKEQFQHELSRLISAKAKKSKKWGKNLDYLVVHTCEQWISTENASEWLEEFSGDAEFCVREAYLLQWVVPGGNQHWPIHRILLTNPA